MVCMWEMSAGRRWGLHAEDVVCMRKMSAGRRCGLHAGDVVCRQKIGNLFTVLLLKLYSKQRNYSEDKEVKLQLVLKR